MTLTSRILILSGLTLGAVAMPGCRGERSDKPPRQIFPDMDDSPKFKPQTKTEFFVDGRAMRQPVAGTVPFGQFTTTGEEFAGQAGPEMAAQSLDKTKALVANSRSSLLREDAEFVTGKDSAGEWLIRMPASIKLDKDMIDRGQIRFDIYCSACHGYDGKGAGTVGAQWSYGLPNFYDPKYTDTTVYTGRDGYIFNTVRYGVDGGAKMPGYAHAINEQDAWAVVAYIRALQESVKGAIDDVPEAQRETIRQQLLSVKASAVKPAAVAPAAPIAPAAPTTPAAPTAPATIKPSETK